MKRLILSLSVCVILLAGCGNDEYANKIDKAVKLQDKKQERLARNEQGDVVKHFDKKDANIYVYEKGNNDEMHYYTYQFKDKKATYLEHFDTKQYISTHDSDYKEENLN